MGASVKFGDYDFDASGTPQWSKRMDFEQKADGQPRIARVTYTIKQTFTEQSFSDNEAKIHLLEVALKNAEGALLIKDENGVVLVNQVAVVKSHTVPESWRQYIAEITVVLETRELLAATQFDMAYTPDAGSQIILPNVEQYRQTTDIARFNDERSNRREIKIVFAASGFILADKSLTPANRRQDLLNKQNAIRASVLANKQGTLSYAGENNTVQIDRLDADIGDGTDRLQWSLSCFSKVFPGGAGYAEADYTVSARDDFNSGRRTTSARGNVRAADEATAKTKAAAIRAQYAQPPRITEHAELGAAILSGTDGNTWVDLTFDFEFSEPIPDVITWELRLETRDDVRSADKIITYSGKVVALTASAALQQAQALGFGKYPVMILGEETVATRQTADGGEQFVEVTFSYEYIAKSLWQYAEVTREVNTDTFGEPREVITGFTVAATETLARSLAATFKLSGRLQRDQRETIGSRAAQAPGASAATAMMTRFDFTYAYYLTPANVSVSYGKEDRIDYATSETSTTFSGIARGPTETACRSFITALIGSQSGKLAESVRNVSLEHQEGTAVSGSGGAGTQMISVSFTERYIGTVATGPDMINAEYSLKTVYSISKGVITTIPYGTPFGQSNVGVVPGYKTITGTATARTLPTAKDWGKARRALAVNGSFCEDQPEETENPVYAPFDGVNVKQYRFSFTYTGRFISLPFS